MNTPKYVILNKMVGQTPLQCTEAWRAKNERFKALPLAYAGRLDPMASGQLLVVIGDECKVQTQYHALDKAYEFSVLFGVSSDTGDVLGRLTPDNTVSLMPEKTIANISRTFVGSVTLPYPHFSSKTVQGKPLHVWTLEGRLGEITIPTKQSTIFKLKLLRTEQKTRSEIYTDVSAKIETITPVTDPSKALGNDFRRTDVRRDWLDFSQQGSPSDSFTIGTFYCIASSGTYMRTLAELIAKTAGTRGLAYHIHRTTIGHYQPLPFHTGFWTKRL